MKFQLAARAKRRQEEKKERFHDSKHNLTTSPPHQRRPTKWRWRRDWADSISRSARTQRVKEIKGKHTHTDTQNKSSKQKKSAFSLQHRLGRVLGTTEKNCETGLFRTFRPTVRVSVACLLLKRFLSFGWISGLHNLWRWRVSPFFCFSQFQQY